MLQYLVYSKGQTYIKNFINNSHAHKFKLLMNESCFLFEENNLNYIVNILHIYINIYILMQTNKQVNLNSNSNTETCNLNKKTLFSF
jgi:hypothetical protein